jgi:uncharacterized protein YjbJ (UPF0337 family)
MCAFANSMENYDEMGLKRQWSNLTDDDLAGIKDKRPQLEGLLKRYYGYDDLKARAEVDAWRQQFE